MLPSVALESTVISHGLPQPLNEETALYLEEIIRSEGALGLTIGILDGRIIAGLKADEIHRLATEDDIPKVSRRNLAVVLATRRSGATTVAATMWIAHKYDIPVFSTGGIGGVHRGSGPPGTGSFDVSADLEELSQTPVAVVCSGAKAILDLPATVEYLETKGVTVIGYGTDEFPAFYSRTSGLPVDVRCDTPTEVAEILRTRRNLGVPGGILVCVPVPEEHAIPTEELEPLIDRALHDARKHGIRAGEVTPFLLKRLSELTHSASLRTNVALLENNARIAARIAIALRGDDIRIA